MPTRLIRSAVLDSEKYHALPQDCRLAFFEILLCADDYGLLHLSHIWLKRRCPVFDGKSPSYISGVLLALADQDLIRVYEANKARFAFIPQFGNRPQAIKPKFPVPPPAVDGGEITALMSTAKNLSRQNRDLTKNEPGVNPVCTLDEPGVNRPNDELRMSNDEVRKEKTNPKDKHTHSPSAPAGVSDQNWTDWKRIRKAKRLPLTHAALKKIVSEGLKVRLTPAEVIEVCCQQGWASFKAEWYTKENLSTKSAAQQLEEMEHGKN